jgi:uncharacterized protein
MNLELGGLRRVLVAGALMGFIFGWAAAGFAEGPSFDCKKAKTRIEKAICASEALSRLDRELSQTYKSLFDQVSEPQRIYLKNRQVQWIKERDKGCKEGADESVENCLKGLYGTRLAELGSEAALYESKAKAGKGSIDTGIRKEMSDLERYKLAVSYVKQASSWVQPSVIPENTRPECDALLADFISGNNIKVIEPIAQFDQYDPEIMAPYVAKCPQEEPFTFYSFEPRIARSAEQEGLPWQEWKKFGHKYTGTSGYRIYRANMNNNASDGDEHVFYAEKFKSERDGRIAVNTAMYQVFNLNTCNSKDLSYLASFRGEDFDGKRNNTALSGIIMHRGTYYFYNLSRYGRLSLMFSKYTKESRRVGIHQYCIFHFSYGEK